jgi:hypothetical protein
LLRTETIQSNGGSLSAGSLQLVGGGKVLLSLGHNKVLKTTGVSIDVPRASRIDLSDNAMIVDYNGASPHATVRAYIKSGYNGGAWNGAGIVSSAPSTNRRLGYADNSAFPVPKTTFAGSSVDATSILIKFTYSGDADLDGDADGVDIGNWAVNFTDELGGLGSTIWTQGDWDYDGT